ncbi:MAG: DUF433 domain-containing protein [Candidatus Nanopelagicales bacterium]
MPEFRTAQPDRLSDVAAELDHLAEAHAVELLACISEYGYLRMQTMPKKIDPQVGFSGCDVMIPAWDAGIRPALMRVPVSSGRRCILVTAVAIEPEPVPLVRDQAGRLMVPGTRISLDVLVAAFKGGESPEAIQENYETVSLADVYAIFAYYLPGRGRGLSGRAGAARRRAPGAHRGGRPT